MLTSCVTQWLPRHNDGYAETAAETHGIMASSLNMIRVGNAANVWAVSARRLAPLMLVLSEASQQHHKHSARYKKGGVG
jgi:hypothetical protein